MSNFRINNEFHPSRPSVRRENSWWVNCVDIAQAGNLPCCWWMHFLPTKLEQRLVIQELALHLYIRGTRCSIRWSVNVNAVVMWLTASGKFVTRNWRVSDSWTLWWCKHIEISLEGQIELSMVVVIIRGISVNNCLVLRSTTGNLLPYFNIWQEPIIRLKLQTHGFLEWGEVGCALPMGASRFWSP